MKKKEIREYVRGCQSDIHLYDLEGPIDNKIEDLRNIRDSAEALGYNNIELELPPRGAAFHVVGTRTETDKEVKNRKESERKMEERRKKENAFYKAKEEERDLKEYLRLKEKFGGKR